MPVLDGMSATRRIRSLLPRTRIVAYAGSGDAGDVMAMMEAGADAYCLKGAPLWELERALSGASDPLVRLAHSIARSGQRRRHRRARRARARRADGRVVRGDLSRLGRHLALARGSLRAGRSGVVALGAGSRPACVLGAGLARPTRMSWGSSIGSAPLAATRSPPRCRRRAGPGRGVRGPACERAVSRRSRARGRRSPISPPPRWRTSAESR